jgi:tRNA modification GTPase
VSARSDTIVAVATAPGRGAIGVVRLSGPGAFAIAARLAGALPPPRHATLRALRDETGAVLDRGLVLAFPGPESFTGEDVVELQGHGGPVVLDLLVRAALAGGARAARPGEFSERAFLNGRIDLAQAEAIADLIDAASGEAARAAQRSLEGELSRRVQALVEELTQLRVFVEGALDFSDEDVDWLSDESLRGRLDSLLAQLARLVADAAQGRRLREGLTVTLTGAPNVGKSTLMNQLAGREVAIVTAIAGTTRDVLRESLVLDGVPITLIDTAGLRDSVDPVEQEGVRRARTAVAQAELALFLVDDRAGLTTTDRALLAELPSGPRVVVLHNKIDLSGGAATAWEDEGRVNLRLSAATGAGVEALLAELRRASGLQSGSEGLFSARTRHLDALRRAQALVGDARLRVLEAATPELAAEELRLAQQALSEITGAFTSDDLLGRIFSAFCIGK